MATATTAQFTQSGGLDRAKHTDAFTTVRLVCRVSFSACMGRASHSVAYLSAVSPPRIANSLHEDLVYIYRNVKGSEQAVAHFIKRHGTVCTPDSFEIGFVRMDPLNPAARAKPVIFERQDATPVNPMSAAGFCNTVGGRVACMARELGTWCGAHPHKKAVRDESTTPAFEGETLEQTYVQNMFLVPCAGRWL